jgi:hypothetical protein
MTAAVLITFGITCLAIAFCVGVNTSMGGTRRDYGDGSAFLTNVGFNCVVIGAALFLIDWMRA